MPPKKRKAAGEEDFEEGPAKRARRSEGKEAKIAGRRSSGRPAASPTASDEEGPAFLPFKNADYVRERIATHSGPGRQWKGLRNMLALEYAPRIPPGTPTFLSIQAGPSRYPPAKYCDITGLPAKYTHPNGIYYAHRGVFDYVQNLTPQQVKQYLDMRRTGNVLVQPRS